MNFAPSSIFSKQGKWRKSTWRQSYRIVHCVRGCLIRDNFWIEWTMLSLRVHHNWPIGLLNKFQVWTKQYEGIPCFYRTAGFLTFNPWYLKARELELLDHKEHNKREGWFPKTWGKAGVKEMFDCSVLICIKW